MAPRKLLSINEKIEVINANENEKLSVRKLAERFQIGKTQAADILKNKDAIKMQWESGSNINVKKKCLTPKGLQVDKLCYEWFQNARAMNISITGPIVKAKAMEIAQQVEYSGFAASDGWLQKWRMRHNISFMSLAGEASEVCPADFCQVGQWDDYENSVIEPSDEDEEIIVQPIDSIKTYDEALQQIDRLQEIASLDYISNQHLNLLKSRFIHLQRKIKQENS